MNDKKGDIAAILIVDDTPANLSLLSAVLNQAGFGVRVARDGESAIRKVQYDPPALILLDVMMPGIDGFETCRRLKANEATKDIPVIFMTALSETVDKVKGFSMGAVDYITKPFQQEEVLARINAHVKMRTLTKTLEQTLSELRATQAQVIQAAKMSSLGQIVAGVAHEINNPISFIYGNLFPINSYIQELLNLLDLYQKTYPNPAPEIKAATESIDLEFMVEDVQKILDSMKVGADRIRNMVLSLRTFSRLNESDIKPVNIHECIDSTLLFLQHRFKKDGRLADIEVVKEYGDVPEVTCYAGELNQVFMHILTNAIDALEEGMGCGNSQVGGDGSSRDKSGFFPCIRIRTEVSSFDCVRIRIIDNGPGMSEDVLHRIFDPFFTTKPVGSGTGLGLSISYQIVVKKHGGRLVCVSAPGRGAEFAIEIPIRQNVKVNLLAPEAVPVSEESCELSLE
ncbi:sensor histidine kinase [Kamptonema formosum]|uniref:sensor histidine kinase n=1 Tax=Kamptonema formosum TaxID=331992 RepID=UPI000344E122|nr:response regulator [Oscillatoria sp. PCC 10802]